MVDDDPKTTHPFTSLSAAQAIGATRVQIQTLARRQGIGVLVPGRSHQTRRFTKDEVERMRLLLTGPRGGSHEAWRLKAAAEKQKNQDE